LALIKTLKIRNIELDDDVDTVTSAVKVIKGVMAADVTLRDTSKANAVNLTGVNCGNDTAQIEKVRSSQKRKHSHSHGDSNSKPSSAHQEKKSARKISKMTGTSSLTIKPPMPAHGSNKEHGSSSSDSSKVINPLRKPQSAYLLAADPVFRSL